MSVQIMTGDARTQLKLLRDKSVHCVVTSPPYFGLRDYGMAGQIGLEPTPEEFVAEIVAVFRDVRRVLRDDGTLWLNLGDSYAGSGRGGNPTEATSTLKGGQSSQIASMVKRNIPTRFSSDRADHTAYVRPPAGLKQKDLMGIPWMVAFALRADGWYLRQDIIWSKPNPMPESVTDRCTKAHEYLFLLSKNGRYHFDQEAIAEAVAASSIARFGQDIAGQQGSDRVPGKTNRAMKAVGRRNVRPGKVMAAEPVKGETTFGFGEMRNRRSVWEVTTQPFKEAHFATFPPALIEPCILAGCPEGGTVLDPFGGAGTTGLVADRLQRDAILIELNPDYSAMARRRIAADAPLFGQGAE